MPKSLKKQCFRFFDGKNISIKSSITIDNPQNKIIVIYNHGGWGQTKVILQGYSI